MRKTTTITAMLAGAILAGSGMTSAYAGPGVMDKAHFMTHHGFMQGHGAGRHARLGVEIDAIPQHELDAMSLEYGVRVAQALAGSAAADAGLRTGDVITAIDGRPAYSTGRVQHLVKQAGALSTIDLVRNGERLSLQVNYRDSTGTDAAAKAVLGIRIQEMTQDLKEAFGAQQHQGVLVSQVMRDSAAEHAGLKAGDVITALGDATITRVADVHRALDAYSPGETLAVTILRDRQPSTLQAALDAAAPGSHPQHPLGIAPLHHRHGHGYHGRHLDSPRPGCRVG